jgi:hypothetical protein
MDFSNGLNEMFVASHASTNNGENTNVIANTPNSWNANGVHE